jgi:hypothetical protein
MSDYVLVLKLSNVFNIGLVESPIESLIETTQFVKFALTLNSDICLFKLPAM